MIMSRQSPRNTVTTSLSVGSRDSRRATRCPKLLSAFAASIFLSMSHVPLYISDDGWHHLANFVVYRSPGPPSDRNHFAGIIPCKTCSDIRSMSR